MTSQLDQKSKETLTKQGYSVVGDHSVVKVCGWTKNTLKGKGGCYKLKFYGIKSHQCMQMSTSVSCANRCSFCWRDYKSPVSKDWDWGTDDPTFILEESLKAHNKQLVGFKGRDATPQKLYEQSTDVKHVALSLTGEPIAYPRMNELVEQFHEKSISTFIVTNAQFPDCVRSLYPITQLYISMDGPNPKTLKQLDVPLFKNYWERFIQSLDYMAKRNDRSAIRITCVKGINMIDPQGYAKLIQRADADFIEVKAYMFVGASQDRLKFENMPNCEEVKEFTHQVLEYLPDYEYISHHDSSRVSLIAKKKFEKQTWIDYPKFMKDFPKQLEEFKKIDFASVENKHKEDPVEDRSYLID